MLNSRCEHSNYSIPLGMNEGIDMVGGATRSRDRPISVPRWWMDEAKRRAAGRGLVELGAELARSVARPEPWNHGSVSRFLSGERVTDGLVAAFVELFDMPRPVYYPRDLAEAALLQAVLRSPAAAAAGIVGRKLAEIDRATDAVEPRALARDRSPGVNLAHNESTGNRRGRGLGGGRTKARRG